MRDRRGIAKGLDQPRIGDQFDQCVRECPMVARRNENTIDAVFDDFRYCGDPRSHHRELHRHGFDEDVRSYVTRPVTRNHAWQCEDVGARILAVVDCFVNSARSVALRWAAAW